MTGSSSHEASATTTSSNSATTSAGSGCVTCTGDVACPVCDDDEYCVLTLLTCSECPRTYCAKKSSSALQSNSSSTTSGSSSHSSSAKVGGIVGGVVGGVAALAIALLLYLYLKYWSKGKRRTRNLLVAHEEYGDTSDVDPSATPSDKPHTQGSQPMLEPRNRSSAATAVTKASNILPIAYIPGVTAGKRGLAKPHPPLPKHLLRSGDTRSHITLGSSILGDDDDDDEGDNAAIGAAAAAARNISSTSTPSLSEKQSPVGADDALTTAIRARPRLVQISEEEDGAEDDDESPVEKEEPSEKEHTVTTLHLHTSDDDEHSLTLGSYPATEPQQSVRANQDNSDDADNERDLQNSGDADDDGDDDGDDDDDDGSFILDVEVPESLRHLANNSHPPANEGSGSPFEDRFYI